MTNESVTLPVWGGVTPIVEDCEVLALVEPIGETGVYGNITAKTYVVSAQTLTVGTQVFVKRHYDLKPTEEGTARVTLFFTKQEFDDYNTAYGNANQAQLPANLKVVQYHGTSTSGLPETYSGTSEVITDVTVALTENRFYIVTFDVSSFSGFFITGQPSAPLPVTFTSFNVVEKENKPLLIWKTISETNSSSFDIEHSINGKNWGRVGEVLAKGESSTIVDYTFLHQTPARGDNFYRLKMIDQDGTFTYSRIKNLYLDHTMTASIYPNPASNFLKIGMKDLAAKDITRVTMFTLDGKTIFTSSKLISDEFDVRTIPSCNYIVTVALKNGGTRNARVVIAR